jgi:hypothetical protein
MFLFVFFFLIEKTPLHWGATNPNPGVVKLVLVRNSINKRKIRGDSTTNSDKTKKNTMFFYEDHIVTYMQIIFR